MLGMCLALVTEPGCDTTQGSSFTFMCVFKLWNKFTPLGGDKEGLLGLGEGQAGKAGHHLLPLTFSRKSLRPHEHGKITPHLSPWLPVTPHSSSSLLEITKPHNSPLAPFRNLLQCYNSVVFLILEDPIAAYTLIHPIPIYPYSSLLFLKKNFN